MKPTALPTDKANDKATEMWNSTPVEPEMPMLPEQPGHNFPVLDSLPSNIPEDIDPPMGNLPEMFDYGDV